MQGHKTGILGNLGWQSFITMNGYKKIISYQISAGPTSNQVSYIFQNYTPPFWKVSLYNRTHM